MAENMTIKGVSVKIGADTSDFIKGLKKVDKEINYSEKQAKQLQKQLEFRFDSKTFSAAQKKIQEDLAATEQKAEAIRKQLKYLEDTGGIDTDGYKKLQVELEKTTTDGLKLEESLKKLNQIKLDQATAGIKKLSAGLETAAKKTAVLSAAAVGAIAGIVKLGKDAVKVGDDIQTTADQYGESAEAIQRWEYIAMQSDVASEQLFKGMTKVRDAIGTALVGETNAATDALTALVGDISKLPTDTEGAFQAVVIALSQVSDSTLQAYYANEIFGERIATQLIPLLNQGADGLAALNQEFEQVGYLSNAQVRELADFDNELNKVNQSFQNAKTELGLALLPILENFANILENKIVPAIQKFSDWFNNLDDGAKNFITTALLLVAALSPVLLIVSKIVGVIPSLLKGLSSIASHPIIAIIGVVAGLLMYLYTTNEQFAKSVNKLFSILGRLLNVVIQPIASILQDIFEILSPIIDLIANFLAPALDLISYLLEPIVWLLEKIDDLWNKLKDGFLTIFGKGWLWGTNETPSATSNSDYERRSIDDYNFNIPTIPTSSNTNNFSNDNYNINVNLTATGNLDYDARSLADEVIKQIVTKKQASGR